MVLFTRPLRARYFMVSNIPNIPTRLAARFAAKEAVSKALGTGMGKVRPIDMEVVRDKNRAPHLYLHGEALRVAEQLGLQTWSISLSHGDAYAVAFVVAIGE